MFDLRKFVISKGTYFNGITSVNQFGTKNGDMSIAGRDFNDGGMSITVPFKIDRVFADSGATEFFNMEENAKVNLHSNFEDQATIHMVWPSHPLVPVGIAQHKLQNGGYINIGTDHIYEITRPAGSDAFWIYYDNGSTINLVGSKGGDAHLITSLI